MPPLTIFGDDDPRHIVDRFQCDCHSSSLSVVEGIPLKNAKTSLCASHFRPSGLNDPPSFILHGQRTVVHGIQGGFPYLVIGTDKISILFKRRTGVSNRTDADENS